MDEKILRKIFRERNPESKKGDFGHLLVIGGSRKYTGAPALVALAALKTGTDVVTIAAPKRAADMCASFSPNLITEQLRSDYLSKLDAGTLIELSKKATAVVIGPGLERKPDTQDVLTFFLKEINIPMVIDADAIPVLSIMKKELAGKKMIITPHAGEFKELTGSEAGKSLEEKMASVFRAAADFKAVIILKGHVDVISDGVKTAVNKTGNPYMTKGGTGDVLAGIAGSLLAQGNDLFDSALAAAYISGKAGDLAAENKKQSLLATDVIDKIEDVLK